MTVYAFIFARGGSKGVPQKNIKLLANKPLIQYAIDVAHQCPQITHVFVSTDDKAIANISLNCGAIVIERPEELASDNASEWLAWQHAIQYVIEHYGAQTADTFISLPATSPLRIIDDVNNALACYQQHCFDLVFGTTDAARSPYFNMVKKNAKGQVSLVCDSSEYTRRQDVPEVFDITTIAYVSSFEFILEHHSLFAGTVGSFHVPVERAIDIDTPFDFSIAQFLMQERIRLENT